MTKLSVGILGLARAGTSVGLALRRYMANGGKYQFDLVGMDTFSANEKAAQKAGAVDKIERSIEATVRNKDIIVVSLPYEDVQHAYKSMAGQLREGTVIIELSSVKQPSFEWAKQFLTEEQHVVGATPIINPKYLFDTTNTAETASEDYFDGGAMVITPSVDTPKEAVDLVFNWSLLIGSKPRFLDLAEHDAILAQTHHLPQLMGVALYYNLMRRTSWQDVQWFTNADFGMFTRPLKDVHPDALRDILMGNREAMIHTLDEVMETLQEVRKALASADRDAIEELLVQSADSYQKWINRRHAGDWDKDVKPPSIERPGFVGMILGDKIANRLTGKKDNSS